uniref:Ankyrin repeat domain 2 n=1 Tax=Anas platyrhynchos TaxID=8839 RepID=A0A8B9SMH9_ANAPL
MARGSHRPVERMSTPELEEEKRQGPRNRGIEAIKGQERVRRSSVDLRREIIDVGSIQRLIELRKQRRKRREERAATPEPPPPPEPLEIVGEGGSQKAGVPWRSSTRGPLVVPAAPALPCPALRRVPWSRRPSCEPPCRARSAVIEKFLADGGSPDTCDEFHRTALHRSSLEGHTDILQKLLDSGATVDFRDRLDCTAVHWACRGGHLDAVKLLQDRGADLNLKDKLLSTPLHVATRTGHPDIVEHLIHCGVDINSPDRVSRRSPPPPGVPSTVPVPPPPGMWVHGARLHVPAGGGHGAARRHAPQPLQDHQDADPARGRHDGQEPGGCRGARGCLRPSLPPRCPPVPALAGWKDPDGAGAAVADGYAPGAGDQGAAAGGGRGPLRDGSGQGPGLGSGAKERDPAESAVLIKPAESRVWPWQAAPGRWWGRQGLRGVLTLSVGVVTPVGRSHEWLGGRSQWLWDAQVLFAVLHSPAWTCCWGKTPARAAQTLGASPAPQCIPKTHRCKKAQWVQPEPTRRGAELLSTGSSCRRGELARSQPHLSDCPAGPQPPHVPRQTLTPLGGVGGTGWPQHPAPWRSAPASPRPSGRPWRLCAGEPPGNTGGSAPLPARSPPLTSGASSHPSPPPSRPCRRWTMPSWRPTCGATPASPSEVSAAPSPSALCTAPSRALRGGGQPLGYLPRVLGLVVMGSTGEYPYVAPP